MTAGICNSETKLNTIAKVKSNYLPFHFFFPLCFRSRVVDRLSIHLPDRLQSNSQNFFAETHGAALLSVYLPRSDHGMGRVMGSCQSCKCWSALDQTLSLAHMACLVGDFNAHMGARSEFTYEHCALQARHSAAGVGSCLCLWAALQSLGEVVARCGSLNPCAPHHHHRAGTEG